MRESRIEKTITFNFDESVDAEAAIFALYAGLRMYKEAKRKDETSGTFNVAAAEAHCMLEQIKETLPDDYIACMVEYDKIYSPIYLLTTEKSVGQIPESITFETKDIIELLTMVDSSLQPDFPLNRFPALLKRIKELCLKYGINWAGRQI